LEREVSPVKRKIPSPRQIAIWAVIALAVVAVVLVVVGFLVGSDITWQWQAIYEEADGSTYERSGTGSSENADVEPSCPPFDRGATLVQCTIIMDR
jgi:hypothetical protein